MDTQKLKIIVELCKMQMQYERERLMTPKMAGALEALKKLKSAGDDVADKITKRITEETMPALLKAEQGAHGTIDGMHTVVDDIEEFTNALKSTNGGDPLDDSVKSSTTVPRSSEVAQR